MDEHRVDVLLSRHGPDDYRAIYHVDAESRRSAIDGTRESIMDDIDNEMRRRFPDGAVDTHVREVPMDDWHVLSGWS